MTYLVSVIVPIYGVASVLEECIESVINQTYKNLEIILVDDGSKDGSAEICDDFAKKDSRIIVIHKENAGVSAARNTGLDSAHGTYISFVDGDDVASPDYIEKLVEAIEDDTDFAFCNYYSFDERATTKNVYPMDSGKYNVQDLMEPIFFGYYNGKRCSMSTSLFLGLFKREIVERKNIRFDTHLRKAEDWIFYAEYLPFCKRMAVVNLPLYGYRQFEGSVMHKYTLQSAQGIERSVYILEKFKELMLSSDVDKAIWEKHLNNRHITMVKRYSLNIWNKQNKIPAKEKYRMVTEYTKNDSVYQGVKSSGIWRSALVLTLYAKCYFLARDARNFLRGK